MNTITPRDLPIEQARLIATAPEMLKMLIEISEALYINDYGDWALETRFDAGSIDEIIAKATGSES